MKVTYGEKFAKELDALPNDYLLKILEFDIHVTKYGLDGLQGKNRRSDGFSNDDPLFAAKMNIVREHNL